MNLLVPYFILGQLCLLSVMIRPARAESPVSADHGEYRFPAASELPVQDGMPDPFLGPNGTRVKSKPDWPAQRVYLKAMLGDAAKEVTITKEMFSKWEDDCDVVAAVDAAAEKLKNL